MRYVQFTTADRLQVGIVDGGRIRPLDFSGTLDEWITCAEEPNIMDSDLDPEAVTILPPVFKPSKIIALGLNYRDHAEESKGEVPEQPLIFAKFPNTLIGHRALITWSAAVTTRVDFEAELAVIIGRRLQSCSEEDALNAIFGYCCANDVSARDLQFGDRQWVRGKSLDTFCPLGPWIVTADEIPDPHDLAIRLLLNGECMQDSNTGLMFFKVPFIVSFLSRHFTLEPGDVILTGTPAGVGAFRQPSVWLQDGDEVVVEIEKLGRLVNRCRVVDAGA